MNILRTFGIGCKRLIKEGAAVAGTVTAVRDFKWMKMDMSLSRTQSAGNTACPHIITYTYSVGGRTYSGSRYADIFVRCPKVNDEIKVYYDKNDPARSTVNI